MFIQNHLNCHNDVSICVFVILFCCFYFQLSVAVADVNEISRIMQFLSHQTTHSSIAPSIHFIWREKRILLDDLAITHYSIIYYIRCIGRWFLFIMIRTNGDLRRARHHHHHHHHHHFLLRYSYR